MKRPRKPSKRRRRFETIVNIARQMRDDGVGLTYLGLCESCDRAGITLAIPEAEAVFNHLHVPTFDLMTRKRP